ncbi:putative non-specific lipid-transfer protein-like protein-like [Capsicum annuum]|nr:putative non-specific lipid-transfer protein-like protein-like [Capsicum annuum]KAF3655143.1 putative non-specific lipid-transfer protein-like protein-like [Capsicum annuum]
MKKLQKLPHVFNTVLELPLRSDADVAVEEKEGFFRFVAKIELEGAGDGQVRAQAVEIYPGITKIVVRKDSGDGDDENIKLLLEQVCGLHGGTGCLLRLYTGAGHGGICEQRAYSDGEMNPNSQLNNRNTK